MVGGSAPTPPHVLAAVRELNRLELVTETLRAALEALAAAAPAWLQAVAPDQWYERYGQRARDWRLPKAEAARAALAVTVGADGFGLLEAVYATETPGWLRQVPAVQTLRPTWILQQYYRGEDGLRWRGKGELPPGALAIGSPTTPRPSARSMPMWANQTNASAMASPDPVTTPTTPMAAGGA